MRRCRINDDIRVMMACRRISNRELSEEIGITMERLHSWLAKPLSRGTDKRIITAIRNLEMKKA